MCRNFLTVEVSFQTMSTFCIKVDINRHLLIGLDLLSRQRNVLHSPRLLKNLHILLTRMIPKMAHTSNTTPSNPPKLSWELSQAEEGFETFISIYTSPVRHLRVAISSFGTKQLLPIYGITESWRPS